MTGVIAVIPKHYFPSATGAPLVNGTLTTYLAGTTTLTPTWQDQALTILNTNPVALDSRGECILWLDSTKVYKFLLKNAGGVTQWTQDNISGAVGAATASAAGVSFIQFGTGAVARTVQSKLREVVSTLDFGADQTGAIDSGPAIANGFISQPIGPLESTIGNYLATTITLPVRGKLHGQGSTIKPSANSMTVISIAAGSSFQDGYWQEIKDVRIDATGKTGITGVAFSDLTGYCAGLVMSNVRVIGADTVAINFGATQFSRSNNIVAANGTGVGFMIKPSLAGGGANSNDFYGAITAGNGIGLLIDGEVSNGSGGLWEAIANNFYNLQANGNTISVAIYSAEANFYGGSPEANASTGAPASITAQGRTIPKCSIFLDKSFGNFYDIKCEDSTALIWAILQNNSTLTLRNFRGGASTIATLVQSDATSIVNLEGKFNAQGLVQNVGSWPSSFRPVEVSNLTVFQSILYGSPVLNFASSVAALLSHVAPTINTYGGTPATLTYVEDGQLGYCANLVCPASAFTSVNQISINGLLSGSSILISFLVKSSIDCLLGVQFYDGSNVRRMTTDTGISLKAGVVTRVVMCRSYYDSGNGLLFITPGDATGPTLKISNLMVYQGVIGQYGTHKDIEQIVYDGSFNPGIVRDTAANLQNIASLVNTACKYPGKQVWCTDSSRTLFAADRNPNSVWKDGVNSTVYTPV